MEKTVKRGIVVMYDVAIIGAGISGAMIARKLSEYKLKICILEKENDVAMGTTKANSAIVHAGFDAECGTLKAKLNVRGSKLMKSVTDELGVKYKNNGSLVLGYNEKDRKTINELYERGIKNGVEKLRIIGKEELKEIEPNVSDDAILALYAPTGAIVCPYELTVAAVGNAMDNGAELKRNFKVSDITECCGVYEITSSSGESVRCRYVINAAGVFADEIARLAGDASFSINPRRGEYILLDKECGGFVSKTIFKTPDEMGKGILVSPTVDGNLLFGPTSEDIRDKTDNSTTKIGLENVISASRTEVKNPDFSKSITSFCGLRAVGSTGDFIINSPKRGFINVAGIESPGLSAAPAIAEYVRDMIEDFGEKLETKSDYSPYRKSQSFFKEASIEEKNEIIKKDKSFGKIVCRCEGVTEGEILFAIRQNPKPIDLDGVKRRTRAQMGRCQGGFCSAHITELLSKELGIKYEDVTKCGGASYINVARTKGDNKNA